MAVTLSSLYFMIIFSMSIFFLALAQDENQFIYNGSYEANLPNLQLAAIAKIHPNGLLQLTNTSKEQMGHAFYPFPIKFNSSSSSPAQSISFSTTLAQYLGLFNSSYNDSATNPVFAIELDTIRNPEFEDRDDNHVGIDVNNPNSDQYATTTYFSKEGKTRSLELISGDPIQVWIDYDEAESLLSVTLAPIRITKPNLPLLSAHINLSEIFLDTRYVGFSVATSTVAASDHYILGWSFNKSGKAQSLEFSKLPELPTRRKDPWRLIIIMVLPIAVAAVLLITIIGATYLYRRRRFEELREEWESEYGPQRFSYKNLYKATNGFTYKKILGEGGFGQVYRGILPSSNQQIAVKRISHDSKQGMKEFVAEIC